MSRKNRARPGATEESKAPNADQVGDEADTAGDARDEQPADPNAASPAVDGPQAGQAGDEDEVDIDVEFESAPAVDVRPPQPAHQPTWVYCRALKTCLVRGMPAFEGANFWMDPEQAERLKAKGSLEIL